MRKTLAASLMAIAAIGSARVAAAQGTTQLPASGEGVTNVGTRGANWLGIAIGGRPQGLGGAAMASVEGPVSLFWNPANIVSREGPSAVVSHMRLFGNSGITNTAGAVTLPIGAGSIGVSIQQFGSGSMERTTEQSPFGGDPVAGGTFSYAGTAAGLYYARNVTDRFAAAIGYRYAQEGIDIAKNSFGGFDLSTRFRTGLYGLTLGGTLQNVGSNGRFRGAGIDRAINSPRENGNPTGRAIPVSFTTREVQMPTVFRLGVMQSIIGDAESMLGASEQHSLMVEGAFTDATDAAVQPSVGVEYGFRRFAFARVGKKFFNESRGPWSFADGLALGGGLRLPIASRALSLDYAYVTMGELQNNQVFSFDIAF